jgi:hypothetical protein
MVCAFGNGGQGPGAALTDQQWVFPYNTVSQSGARLLLRVFLKARFTA